MEVGQGSLFDAGPPLADPGKTRYFIESTTEHLRYEKSGLPRWKGVQLEARPDAPVLPSVLEPKRLVQPKWESQQEPLLQTLYGGRL